jgi:cytochrome oxidase assembly protein ShyY1
MLRQPRYAALSLLMVIVAIVCVLAGTWQIARLASKFSANHELRHNAHASPAPVAAILPLVGAPGAPPHAHAVQFRAVRLTGTFDPAHQGLVRQRSVDDNSGYLVLTPFRTAGGTVLLVRGFVAAADSGAGPPSVPAPPAGSVTVRARVEPAETKHDQAAHLPNGELESINPREQAARLGTAVFDGYAELLPRQPGASGLTAIPPPDLSNPAGGAVEPQHLAYVVQWYLFALLALAAPIAIVRAETRHVDERDFDERAFDVRPAPAVEPEPRTAEQERAAKLADRYGRAVGR